MPAVCCSACRSATSHPAHLDHPARVRGAVLRPSARAQHGAGAGHLCLRPGAAGGDPRRHWQLCAGPWPLHDAPDHRVRHHPQGAATPLSSNLDGAATPPAMRPAQCTGILLRRDEPKPAANCGWQAPDSVYRQRIDFQYQAPRPCSKESRPPFPPSRGWRGSAGSGRHPRRPDLGTQRPSRRRPSGVLAARGS